jgi:uncharacterized Ntn-hydrolase superfamily protein
MTFSIVAIDPSTGSLGAACATSDIAVGARVPWTRAHVGATVTQHTTDPRLGTRGLDLLAAGRSASDALEQVAASAIAPDARQLALVDALGRSAVYSGRFVDPSSSFALAGDGFAVVGNMLANPAVGPAIVESWLADAGQDLSARLVAALLAGLAAGGETFALRSAAVTVHRDESFPYVDLRIDDDENPLHRLAALVATFTPLRDGFVRRAIDPDLSYVTHIDTTIADSAVVDHTVSHQPESSDPR